MKKIITYLFLTSLFIGFSQEKTLTLNDAVLGYYKGLYPQRLQQLQWITNTNNYIYQTENQFVISSANNNQPVLNISLNQLKNQFPNLKRLPWLNKIDNQFLIFKNNRTFNFYDYKNNVVSSQITYNDKGLNTDLNLKAKAVAYTIDNNLFIATVNNEKIAVTDFKDANIVSGQSIHRNEFGIKKGTFWSPNGHYLAFYQKDESNVTNYPLVDITTYPASLKSIKYPMAGQGSEKAKIGIYNVKTQQTTYLKIDTSDEHYLTNLTWSPDEKYILVAEVNRGQNHLWYNRYSVATGNKINTIFEEKNDKWVEPEFDAVFLPNSNSDFLYLSEKDGFMNIYQYNLSGSTTKQITNFNWVVTQILGFDTQNNVYIEGTGKDPRESHSFKVNLSTGEAENLNLQAGTHQVSLSYNGLFLLDSYSNLTTPRNTQIIKTSDLKRTSIFKAPNPLKDYKLGKTEFVNLKADDGTVLYGKITKPANFDAAKKYPVLIYVYGGPHAQLVTNSWLGGSRLWATSFASLHNYIVFTLDNRGTENRGFKFESIIHRHLGDVEIKDQMVGVNYLKSLPYVDSKRIAVNGWSFGGFMTLSLMLREPGVFTTAVAGGPVTDWKYYEVMYGERYMDTPQENPQGYRTARVHNYIENLKGHLLIINGSVDPTVVPQHSLTLLKEAVSKNVQLDYFTYPMHEHNVRGKDRVHLLIKMMNYIVEHNK
ncbi:MAG: DPP IV N-terminal domain-containing protein [Lutibacter sp.]